LSDTAVFEPPLVDLFLGPGEGFGCLVVCCDESIDVLLQLLDGGEGGAVQGLALQDRKPCFDLIEPRRPGWGETETDFGVFLEPALVLLVRVEIVEDDVKLAVWEGATTASTNRRLLCAVAPGSPTLPGSSGAIRFHCPSFRIVRIKADLHFSALNQKFGSL
jgi:hypothetical protein